MIASNFSGVIVALRAKNGQPQSSRQAGRMRLNPQIRPRWEISNQKAEASLSSVLGVKFIMVVQSLGRRKGGASAKAESPATAC